MSMRSRLRGFSLTQIMVAFALLSMVSLLVIKIANGIRRSSIRTQIFTSMSEFSSEIEGIEKNTSRWVSTFSSHPDMAGLTACFNDSTNCPGDDGASVNAEVRKRAGARIVSTVNLAGLAPSGTTAPLIAGTQQLPVCYDVHGKNLGANMQSTCRFRSMAYLLRTPQANSSDTLEFLIKTEVVPKSGESPIAPLYNVIALGSHAGEPLISTSGLMLTNPNCPAGQIVKGWNNDGSPICITANRCPANQVLKGINSDGTLNCAPFDTAINNGTWAGCSVPCGTGVQVCTYPYPNWPKGQPCQGAAPACHPAYCAPQFLATVGCTCYAIDPGQTFCSSWGDFVNKWRQPETGAICYEQCIKYEYGNEWARCKCLQWTRCNVDPATGQFMPGSFTSPNYSIPCWGYGNKPSYGSGGS